MLLPSRDQQDRGTSLEDRLQLELANDAASLCEQLKQTQNMDAYIDILARLWTLEGGSYDTGLDIGSDASLRSLTENLYVTAGRTKRWAIVRRAAALLGKSDETLGDAVVEIVIRQKQLAVGRAYSLDAVISEPMSNTDLLDKIRTYCGDDAREHILHQELVIYLAMLIKAEPALFEDMLTLRIGHMLQLIVAQQARIHHWPQHTAFEYVLTLSPHTLTMELREVLAVIGVWSTTSPGWRPCTACSAAVRSPGFASRPWIILPSPAPIQTGTNGVNPMAWSVAYRKTFSAVCGAF